jgi:RNA polymerase sigma factor for flagellar operon FliA
MQVQMVENNIPLNERLTLECILMSLDQRLGRPASDDEICEEMNISLDEFHQMLDQFKGLTIGSFQKTTSPHGNARGETLIRYIPDASRMDKSIIFLKSEVRKQLSKAIDTLPKIERLLASLYYFDELTLKEIESVLGISEASLSYLQTKAVLRLRSKLSKEQASLLFE